MTPELELIDQLRETTLSPEQERLLDEIEVLLNKDILWPLPVREEAERIFGGAIHNSNGRTHKSLDRRIRHALRVWRHRYGMNPEQHTYAGDVIAWAIRTGGKDAPNERLRFPYTFKAIDRLVNDESVHAGMQRRARYAEMTEAQLEAAMAAL